MRTGKTAVVDMAKENVAEVEAAISADEAAELARLRAENETLKQGVAAAAQVIAEVENPPMPPIVTEEFVVPAEVVGLMCTIGRQLSREGLVHGTSGNISMLGANGLVHISRTGSALSLMNESDVITGRLGEAAPPGASMDWGIHTIALALASLEHDGRGACVHIHAPYATALSMEAGRYALVPEDWEGKASVGSAAIVDVNYEDMDAYLGSIRDGFKQSGNKVVVARGHGIYATGADLVTAWQTAAAFEHSMKVVHLNRMAQLE